MSSGGENPETGRQQAGKLSFAALFKTAFRRCAERQLSRIIAVNTFVTFLIMIVLMWAAAELFAPPEPTRVPGVHSTAIVDPSVTLGEGVHFVQDLIGLEVLDADDPQKRYGKLTDVIRTGANDVYEITDDGVKTYLAPVIDEVVIKIDVDGGFVLLRPMKGIFDDED